MRRVLSTELASHAGERVTIAGWVHRRRLLAGVSFLIVRDRAGLAQVVVPAGVPVPAEETVVTVAGRAVANPVAPGGVEVVEPEIEIIGAAEPPAIELFRPRLGVGLPALLDHAPVTLRHPARRAVFAASAATVGAFRARLDALGFTEVYTPKIVANATESGDRKSVV